jgi:L-threonylcarbamoyladenylate synthase
MTLRLRYGPDAVARAAAMLVEGRTVAFPTETVYGLGARADWPSAVQAIFEAKGRAPENPLIVHVADIAAARALAARWTDEAERLAAAFWPGPLTLVVEARAGGVAREVTAGGPTVALRVPSHPVARELIIAVGLPIAAPSANRSTTVSPTTADHVLKTLEGRIDCVLDAGAAARGIESTIVDVSRSPAVVLRQGAIPLEVLRAVVPLVDESARRTKPGGPARSPGSYSRHYAPRAKLVVVPPSDVARRAEACAARGERVGVISCEGEASLAASNQLVVISLPTEPEAYASGLYAALHRLDDEGCHAIIVGDVPAGGAWDAIRDRLRRGSAEE